VPPPGAPDWEQAAAAWLIDLCPADFRAYPVLRRHPVALAWMAAQHVAASREAMARSLGRARADLAEVLAPRALEEVLGTLEHEQARLMSAARGVQLIEQALRGQRFVPRM
jgi:hypothetical protein